MRKILVVVELETTTAPGQPTLTDETSRLGYVCVTLPCHHSPRPLQRCVRAGELDILDGSPPCPPFSMSGTKQKGWNKEKVAYGMKQQNIEDLTWEMIRITSEMKPKVVICENVKGLTMDYAKQHLDRMCADFEKEGYTTTYKVMNGIHFGVPQKRQRVIIVVPCEEQNGSGVCARLD